MQERINQGSGCSRPVPHLEYRPDGQWIRVPKSSLPSGWNLPETPLALQIPVQYPGAPPYGIYVPVGLLFNGKRPEAYTEPAPAQPLLVVNGAFFRGRRRRGPGIRRRTRKGLKRLTGF